MLAVPNIAMASHATNGLDGLVYVLGGLIVLVILFITNLVMYFSNIRTRSKGRAIAVIMLSAPIVATSAFVCVSLLANRNNTSPAVIIACAGIAAAHVAMMVKSVKMIQELKNNTFNK
jgi:hypothetical protein